MKQAIFVTAWMCAALCFFPRFAAAQVGSLESPVESNDVPQTGIATIFGWHCTSRNIVIRIDGGAPMKAITGISRADTASVCNRTATGFSLLFNYNQLPLGLHTIAVTADGVEFARRQVRVDNFGEEFLSGKTGYIRFFNFPGPGEGGRVIWDQERQNFTLEGVYPASEGAGTGMTGTYHGAVATQCPEPRRVTDIRYARFEVTYPSDEQIDVDVTYADGERCSISGVRTTVDMDRQLFASLTSNCIPGRSTASTLQVDGRRLEGVFGNTIVPHHPFACGNPRVFFATKEGVGIE